ncbi:MAG: chromosome segregation protein SMC [Calditrichota bacterium]
MFINRLEMTGFKSFAGRTVIEFRPGVMAVVGPNGCGKTNIVDAIRWVLGEQRTGALRADRMEGVIFNGSSRRKPLGMSEVTLTLDNDRGRLPAVYSEVAVTRRLFRSGESEYLINRNSCRLRDIHDLFADTGFGHSTYSIMELSVVERIITGPSEDRRALLEEAAGVAKYKSRRQAAERRLDSTRDNLARLDDVFIEVEKNYRTLKRQASRAHRYQEISQALALRLTADLSGQYLDLKNHLTKYEKALSECDNHLQQLEVELSRRSAELISFEGRELVLMDRASRAQDTSKRLDRREAELKGELALARQRAAYLEIEREQSQIRRRDLDAAWTRIQEAQSKSVANDETNSERLRDCETRLANLEKELSAARESCEKTASRLAGSREQEASLRRKWGALQDERRRKQGEIEHLRLILQRSSADSQGLIADIEALEKNAGQTESELQKAIARTNTFKEALIRAESELEASRRAHQTSLQARALASAALAATRSTLSAHQQQRTTSAAWPRRLKRIAAEKSLTSLAARIECPAIYKAALASALGQVLEAVDLERLDEAFNLVGDINPTERAIIRIPPSEPLKADLLSLPDLPPDCVWASDIIQNAGELGQFFRNRLWRTLITIRCNQLLELSAWAAEHNLILVGRDGERLEPDGVLYLGKIDPEGLQLGWNSRFKELSGTVDKAEKELESAENKAKQAAAQLASTESSVNEARKALRIGEDQIVQLERRLNGYKTDIERLNRRKQEIIRDASEQTKRLKTFEESVPVHQDTEVLEKETARLSLENTRLNEELTRSEKIRLELSESRGTLNTERVRLTERLAATRKDVQDAASEMNRIEAERAGFESKLAQSEAESTRVIQAAANLESQLNLLDKELRELLVVLEQANNEKKNLQAERQKSKIAQDQAQKEQRESLREHSRLEGELIGQRTHLSELERRLTEDAGLEVRFIDADTTNAALVELETLGLSEISLETLKSRLAALGPVNMLALDELKEIESRYNFLTDQKQDLVKAIETLEEIIDRINIEARLRLRDTYEQINHNFQDLFKTLFEGGEARLTLEGTDPLESDVRIWATPSGKKLQTLSMLSGGEKALTAIALLFAIYQVRPSPFCILDEVDAPLDDANILRFNRLIRNFSRDTQFLMVTHNKRTMESADSLFGVTLNDEGVSQIVSVKIEK